MKDEVIFLGSDHAGFRLKEKVKKFLDRKKIKYDDLGAKKFEKEDDYPDYIIPAVKKAVRVKSKAIVFGYSGQGEAIAANKVKGVRAIVFYGKEKKIISLGRKHNDANVLSLGAGFIKERDAFSAVEKFLKIKFSNSKRHKRRINKIKKFESG